MRRSKLGSQLGHSRCSNRELRVGIEAATEMHLLKAGVVLKNVVGKCKGDQVQGKCHRHYHRDEPLSSASPERERSQMRKRGEKIRYTWHIRVHVAFLQGYSMQKTGVMGRDREGPHPLISTVSLP